MKILIELFRGCISDVKAPVSAEVTILDRNNLSESCSVTTFSPTQASEAEIDTLIQLELDAIAEAANAREEQRKAEQAKKVVDLWGSDSVQFARLLSELKDVGLKPSQMVQLATSMTLTKEEIHQLLDRAKEAYSVMIKEMGLGPPDVDGG